MTIRRILSRVERSVGYRTDRLLRRLVRPEVIYSWWWWRSPNRPHVGDRRLFRELDAIPTGSRGLDLGAGGLRARPDAVTLDVRETPGVDVVAAGGALPFADGVFDYVWSNAVLEHVPDPFTTAGEICRVLRPGGIAIIHVPFLEQIHSWPHDYFRYTPSGLRVLFQDLEEVACGPTAGPSQVLPDLLQYYAVGFSDLQQRGVLLNLWCVFVGIWLLPIRWLDRLIWNRPTAWHWSRAFYYIGRKPFPASEAPDNADR